MSRRIFCRQPRARAADRLLRIGWQRGHTTSAAKARRSLGTAVAMSATVVPFPYAARQASVSSRGTALIEHRGPELPFRFRRHPASSHPPHNQAHTSHSPTHRAKRATGSCGHTERTKQNTRLTEVAIGGCYSPRGCRAARVGAVGVPGSRIVRG